MTGLESTAPHCSTPRARSPATPGAAILDVYGRPISPSRARATTRRSRKPTSVAHRIIAREPGRASTAAYRSCPKSRRRRSIAARRSWPRYWLVDPLDGTKEFLKRNGEFTVNIALVDRAARRARRRACTRARPHVLRRGRASARGARDGRRRAATDRSPQRRRGAAARRRQPQPPERRAGRLSRRPSRAHEITDMGSSLKICLVAEGAADIYPRLGPDLGVGHGRGTGYPRKCGRAYDRPSRPAAAVQLQRRPVESLIFWPLATSGGTGWHRFRTARGRQSRH